MKDTLHTIGHAPHDTTEYAEYLSQSERLAAYASRHYEEEMNELETVAASRPPHGFTMPSMSKVRNHDALLNAGIIPAISTHEDEEDEEQDEETELRQHAYAKRSDSLREHSFRLPSQRSRRDVSETLRSMGCTYSE